MSLAKLGKNNPNYKHGENCLSKRYFCEKCGKEVWIKGNLCKSCCKKGIKYSITHRKNLGKAKLGNKNPAKQYWVRKKISRTLKDRWKDDVIRKTYFSKLSIYPKQINNSERKLRKFLNYLFPRTYKFVGNGKFIINHYNPDFVDVKNKRIIELYGDYWHDRLECKKKDKYRLKLIRKEGYQVLVIWEHELLDLNKLMFKLYCWHNIYDYNFFQNFRCKYFPCHKNIKLKSFSCMLCFCPLFTYKNCEGDFIMRDGKKDCSHCLIPHEDYDHVIKFLKNELKGK